MDGWMCKHGSRTLTAGLRRTLTNLQPPAVSVCIMSELFVFTERRVQTVTSLPVSLLLFEDADIMKINTVMDGVYNNLSPCSERQQHQHLSQSHIKN